MDLELQQLLSELDPETLSEILGDTEGESTLLNQQMARAQALRGTPMPEAKMVSGYYIRPSALSQISAAGQRFMGGMQAGDVEGQQKDLLRRKVAARLAYLRSLSGKQQAPEYFDPMAGAGDMPDQSDVG